MIKTIKKWILAVVERPLIAVLMVCLFGLVTAVLAGFYLQAIQHREQVQRFDDLSRRAVVQLQARIQTYEYGLRGVQGVVLGAGVEGISRSRFHDYMSARDLAREFPGARGYGFIRRIRSGQEESFLSKARADGWPDFRIREFAPHDDDRWVIQYLEPAENNAEAIGLDVASEVHRRDALLAAVAGNAAILTRPITLVQTGAKIGRASCRERV